MHPISRRTALKTTALAAAALTMPAFAARGSSRLKIGVIGCGGRGTGAAVNALQASPDTEITALGDMFPDKLQKCLEELGKQQDLSSRAAVPPERCFLGFDAYKKVLATDIDLVILATPPGFRPIHFEAAVDAGKQIFFEKPVAVDPAGIRKVLEAAAKAKEKNLSVVTGTQRRHEACYLEAMKRVKDGAIGDIESAAVFWNQGGLWMNKRQPAWSDMEWQLRNWLYFAWLSGDHIVEQHVHNIDVAHWYMDANPIKVSAMGGRQSRTNPDYGHVYDHFACEFEYENGRRVTSYCRQVDGASGRVEEVIYGTKGQAILASGRAEITGANAWKWNSKQEDPYVQEHKDLIASITGAGPHLNEAQRIAESCLTAIMGRMSAYTGKTLTWQQAMDSKLDLSPQAYELGSIPTPEVAIPGKTKLI
jgi:myo-inositol 2-dehydrogenase / D-chiro-inositol 1-dehydrogenase